MMNKQKINIKSKIKIQVKNKNNNQLFQELSADQLKFLEEKGYIVIPNIISEKERDQMISELWDILEATPHSKEYQLKRPQDPLDCLTSAEIKELEKNWIQHKNYGMVNEPPIWHTEAHWKLRQDPRIYSLFTKILGAEELWCTIDRATIKLPNQGEEEFNHWDCDPWWPYNSSEYQGIVNLTNRQFRCVPGSQTTNWQTDFKNEYTYLASDFQRTMVRIDPDKDSWNLGQILPDDQSTSKTKYNCIRDIVCPACSLVIFSSNLMHSVAKNKTNRIVYGLYLSYFRAGNRDLMGVYNRLNYQSWNSLHPNVQPGDTEIADRIRSYQTGTAPYRFPSGGLALYFPLRTLKWILRKRQKDAIDKHPRTGNPWIFEKSPKNYQPPQLTSLGRKLLGLDLYPQQKPQQLKLNYKSIQELQKNGFY